MRYCENFFRSVIAPCKRQGRLHNDQ